MVISLDNTTVRYAAGIAEEKMNYYAATQIGEQWCWAAVIQMFLNYYGVSIGQEQIVAKTHGVFPNGDLPDLPATYEMITENLNYRSYDIAGRKISVKGDFYSGYPNHIWLINELSRERPVIVVKKVDETTQHALLITAVEYFHFGNNVLIDKIICRDPWPGDENRINLGRVELDGSEAATFQAYWAVRVQ